MYREDLDIDYIKDQLACANADLYQGCGTMPLSSLESLCRKINLFRLKLYSFKGGRYGKRNKDNCE